MQYSDTALTYGGGIVQAEEQLCNLGNGGIANNTTLLKQFAGYNNRAYYEIWMAQLSVDRKMKADDYNYTDYPDAPITMIVSQQDYTIPVATTGANVATFLRLNGIYFTVNGERTYLRPMEEDEQLSSTAAEPTAYRMNGKSIWFNCPMSAATLTKYSSTFYVEFQRVPDAFAYNDTTQQPGFMETYHDLIPLRASAWYLLPINPTLATQYEQRFLARLELFKRDVANMDSKRENVITPAPIAFM
jgi:hypothetical protein